MNEPIYLDNNATTKIAPEVIDAMKPYLDEFWGNPSSPYNHGNQVKRAIDKARIQVASLIGAEDPNEIIFTSGGSESNNMALNSGVQTLGNKSVVISSPTEHSAILGPIEELQKKGHKVIWLSVNEEGNVNLDGLHQVTMQYLNSLTSIMWANNETGVISPIKEIIDIVKTDDSLFHTDAVQAVGKIPINVSEYDIDMLSFSGHKIYGPKGIGVLYAKRGTRVHSLIHGGHQERGRRGGTENVLGIVGLGKACELTEERMNKDIENISYLRNKLEQGILSSCIGSVLNGDKDNRLPNTTNISFEHLDGEAILFMLDDRNICVSTGSACESGSLEASHVLKSMEISRNMINGAIRFSLGRYSTENDVNRVLEELPNIIKKCRELVPHLK
ncbi:MAG: aminotransferase class V-fold PLP-dependent enzyme [Verrucomicrobiota bacterium]|nr:aminotransferase class V-fold PLP-dependent enzyme [Verrucomicrobiota bacterium]